MNTSGKSFISPKKEYDIDFALLKKDYEHLNDKIDRVDQKVDRVEQRVDKLSDKLDRFIEKVDDRMERDFRLTFGALITVALGLAAMMAKGFHWI